MAEEEHMLRKAVRSSLGRLRRWLEEEPEGRPPNPEEDDFIYPWLNSLFSEMARHGLRRSYAWGVLQGVNLARALGIHRVSLIEFGVAGGNGQVALEGIAEKVEDLFGVRTDIYGFD